MDAGANDLTTLEDVKRYLQITQVTTDDLLQTLITSVSDAIEVYCNRGFALRTYTTILNNNGAGSRVIVPVGNPVVSVESLSINGIPLAAVDNERSAGFWFDNDYIFLIGYSIPGFGGLEISYTAGYAEVPPSIKQAANEWVGFSFKEISRIGEASKVLAGETVSYITDAMPKRVQLILDKFKNVVPARSY